MLKGAAFAESLMSATADGIAIEPLYGEMNGPRAWREDAAPWIVSQRIDLPDAGRRQCAGARRSANMAPPACRLIFHGAASGHGFGLNEHDERSDRPRLGRYAARLHCLAHGARPAWPPRRGGAFSLHRERSPSIPNALIFEFGMDPIGALASRGDLAAPWPDIAERLPSTVDALRGRHFTGPFMRADGRIWHDAGATEAQELGLILSTAVAYLRALESTSRRRLGARHRRHACRR